MINILEQKIKIGNTPAKTYFQNRSTAVELRHLLKFPHSVFALPPPSFSSQDQLCISMVLIKPDILTKTKQKPQLSHPKYFRIIKCQIPS
jgi:hypothetical protein